jgi:type 1 glutamine amidotransferase
MKRFATYRFALIASIAWLVQVAASNPLHGQSLWLDFPGGKGIGEGKHVVFVTGDEEYRSEESGPQLAKILSNRHGFRTTVLFAIEPETGEINPKLNTNIPGLEAVDRADLVVMMTRFRDLPDDQMKHLVDYFEAGRPIVGLRTATHAFNIPAEKTFARYGNYFEGKDYEGGFGQQVLGEKWVSHHGDHKVQSTRGVIAPEAQSHPIARGLTPGSIWGPTDVYGVALPLRGDGEPIVLGQVLEGMKFDDAPLQGDKNEPMMPVAWTRSYKGGRVFTTTMGAATDLVADGTRRMVINGILWALSMDEQITPDLDIAIVGTYEPTPYGFDGFIPHKKPQDYK